MTEPEIVVTGLGAISSVGKTVPEMWDSVVNGVSGGKTLNSLSDKDPDISAVVAHEITDFDPTEYDYIDERMVGKFAQFGLVAAYEAIKDAGLDPTSSEWEENRVGTSFGTCAGGTKEIEEDLEARDRFRFYIGTEFLPNMAAGHISGHFETKGPCLAPTSACATGTHAIDTAAQELRKGRADVMIAGGGEKASSKVAIGTFDSLRAYSSNFDDCPTEACRPFDQKRDGVVVGDGSGALILETRDHAEERNADIYATVAGTGATADGAHPISQPEDANGLTRAIEMAVDDAELEDNSIDYISAHATSTSRGDIHESTAINKAFDGDTPYVTAMKSQLGHTLGAAGALEGVLAIKSMQENVIPPTINQEQIGEECNIQVVDQPINRNVSTVLSNSAGFGGTNGTVIFSDIYG